MTDTWGLGQTLRWHSSPWWALRMSGDTVDAHQQRMIRLARHFFASWKPAKRLQLIDAITDHDLPEVFTGDWSTPDKDSIPGLREMLAELDALILLHIGADDWPDDIGAAMKWLDVLDAYKWAAHVEPRAIASGGFPEAARWLHGEAWALGIGHLRAHQHCGL